MSDDADSRIHLKPSTAGTPSSREAQRAEALRANLMRRKAQARERSERAEVSAPKPSGDA
jgi:hypothetical protein